MIYSERDVIDMLSHSVVESFFNSNGKT